MDLARVVFQLVSEDAKLAVAREPGMRLGAGDAARAGDRARDLARGDAVVLVEENVWILGAVAVGGEGDEERRLVVLGGDRKGGEKQGERDHDAGAARNLQVPWTRQQIPPMIASV